MYLPVDVVVTIYPVIEMIIIDHQSVVTDHDGMVENGGMIHGDLQVDQIIIMDGVVVT